MDEVAVASELEANLATTTQRMAAIEMKAVAHMTKPASMGLDHGLQDHARLGRPSSLVPHLGDPVKTSCNNFTTFLGENTTNFQGEAIPRSIES